MMSIPFDVLLTDKLNNYVEDATTNWDSTTEHILTVPANKRWIILGGVVNRDVSTGTASLTITLHDSSDNIIGLLLFLGDGTGQIAYPNPVEDKRIMSFSKLVLDANEYVKFVIGEAQGAGAYLSCMVLEIPIGL